MAMRWLLLLQMLGLCGCAQRIKVPISRMVSPETIGKGIEIEYRQVGVSEGQLDFTSGDTDNPLLMTTVSNRSMNMGFGPIENADFFISIHQESCSLLGLKMMLVGDDATKRGSGHKLAVTLAMGAERDTYAGEYEIKLKPDVKDYALIYGHRLNSVVLFYTGISLSNYDFSGTILGASEVLKSHIVDYSAQNILGWNGGVELGSSSFKFKVELAAQKIAWTNTEEKQFYSGGLSLTAAF